MDVWTWLALLGVPRHMGAGQLLRGFPLWERMVWQGTETCRGAHYPNALEQLVKGCVPPAKRPQGAGCSSRQQDALAAGLAATTVPYSMTRDQRSTLDVRSAPVAPSTCFCPPVWCCWRTGVQAQPCHL